MGGSGTVRGHVWVRVCVRRLCRDGMDVVVSRGMVRGWWSLRGRRVMSVGWVQRSGLCDVRWVGPRSRAVFGCRVTDCEGCRVRVWRS